MKSLLEQKFSVISVRSVTLGKLSRGEKVEINANRVMKCPSSSDPEELQAEIL